MSKVREWRTKTDVSATCMTCDKDWYGPHAHGVGVQHARKHKHLVHVQRSIVYAYDHEPDGGIEKSDFPTEKGDSDD